MEIKEGETAEVSRHQILVFRAVQAAGKNWVTSAQVTETTKVSARTARSHLLRLVKLGICDLTESFPCHHYRFSDKAAKRNRTYLERLEKVAEVLGL